MYKGCATYLRLSQVDMWLSHLMMNFKRLQKVIRSLLTILRRWLSVEFSRELNAEEAPQQNKELLQQNKELLQQNKEALQQNKEAPQQILEAPEFFISTSYEMS